jgi:hypothetical protein
MAVNADASAMCGVIRSTSGLLPIAVEWDDFEYGVEYALTEGMPGPGAFHWLDWNDPPVSAPELAAAICNPENSGVWNVGDWVNSCPGSKTGEAKGALDTCWMSKPEEERHATLIIYDQVEGGGATLQYHIAGFAEFTLTGYVCEGATIETIYGTFRRWVKGGFVDLECPGYGVYGVRLTE